eukprot:861407-Alexandrium_andersonii.AAC.1
MCIRDRFLLGFCSWGSVDRLAMQSRALRPPCSLDGWRCQAAAEALPSSTGGAREAVPQVALSERSCP